MLRSAGEPPFRGRYPFASEMEADLQRLKRRQGLGAVTLRYALVAAVLLAFAAGLTLYTTARAGNNSPFTHATFTQLTERPEQDLYPALAPDGESVVYASMSEGNWDLFLQEVGDKRALSLTAGSGADNTQPSFSPDGKHLAFRSTREGGGIFVMPATGGTARRVAAFGYHPVWSPDGKQIAYATDTFRRPDDRWLLTSEIHLIDVATGRTWQLAGTGPDAVQPHWSPQGLRIAFWGVEGGRRDIWTTAATGGDRVRVTSDAYVDWNPVWSPDGSYLYFSSDRGGSMNLWRVRIDERSGKVLGTPERVTTPSLYSGHMSFATGGRRMAYVQLVRNSNLRRAGLDLTTGRLLNSPAPVTRGLREAVHPDVAPDGRSLVFSTWGKEDLFIGQADGSGIRRITDDLYKDRGPRWSPDGRRIAFQSNRSGHFEMWIVNADGSGLRQLTRFAGINVINGGWSPDGTRIACSFDGGERTYVVKVDSPWDSRAQPISPPVEPAELFFAKDWSHDGSKIAGFLVQRADSLKHSVAVYSLDTGVLQRVPGPGRYPRWLTDGRRLVYGFGSRMYLADVLSGSVRELFSVRPDEIQAGVAIADQNRTIYFTQVSTEADIWLMEFIR